MEEQIKKILSEGLSLPVTVPVDLVVSIKFKTAADESLFKAILGVAQRKEEIVIAQPTPVVTTPAVEIMPQAEPETKMVEVISVVSAGTAKQKTEVPKQKQQGDKEVWQTEKIAYRVISGGDDKSRYGEHDDQLIFRREKIHFVTTWEEIETLSKLSKDNLVKTAQLRKYSDYSKPTVLAFIQAYKDGKIKRKAPVEKSTGTQSILVAEPTKITKTEDVLAIESMVHGKKFTVIRGTRHLSYLDHRHMLFIKSNDVLIQTTWREMSKLSEMTEKALLFRLDELYDGDKDKREAVIDFVDALIAGRVRDPEASIKPMLRTETGVKKYSGGYEGHIEGTLED